MMKKLAIVCVILALRLALTLPAMATETVLRVATTTSTDNTGFLDYLAPHFTKAFGNEDLTSIRG
jgi:tungstate transport system substrate-binding protein